MTFYIIWFDNHTLFTCSCLSVRAFNFSIRDVSHHPEAYVRRSVLFAASCILVALHPSYVASALIEGNQDISTCLEWIRTYSLQVAEADSDTECASVSLCEVCMICTISYV